MQIQCDQCKEWFRNELIRMPLINYRLYQRSVDEPFSCIQHVDRISYCFCQRAPVVGDKWVQCDKCDQWFHLRCLRLSYAPSTLVCSDHIKASENRASYLQTPLGRDGYCVVRGALDTECVRKLLQQAKEALRNRHIIFNDNEQSNGNDRLRYQADFHAGPQLPEKVTRLLQPRSTWKWHVLESEAGCQRQAVHADYNPRQFDASDPNVPHSVLVALQPSTYFDVWPGAHHLYHQDTWPRKKIAVKCVELQPGDVLVFRADTVHAGSSYTTTNVRLHAFCGRQPPPINMIFRWERCMPDGLLLDVLTPVR